MAHDLACSFSFAFLHIRQVHRIILARRTGCGCRNHLQTLSCLVLDEASHLVEHVVVRGEPALVQLDVRLQLLWQHCLQCCHLYLISQGRSPPCAVLALLVSAHSVGPFFDGLREILQLLLLGRYNRSQHRALPACSRRIVSPRKASPCLEPVVLAIAHDRKWFLRGNHLERVRELPRLFLQSGNSIRLQRLFSKGCVQLLRGEWLLPLFEPL